MGADYRTNIHNVKLDKLSTSTSLLFISLLVCKSSEWRTEQRREFSLLLVFLLSLGHHNFFSFIMYFLIRFDSVVLFCLAAGFLYLLCRLGHFLNINEA